MVRQKTDDFVDDMQNLLCSTLMLRKVSKKMVFFGTLSQTMGRWGSKVPNFLVKKKRFFRTLPQNRGGGGWVGVQGASSVHMTKHFYDVRLHDLVYMTSIYMTQLLHDTRLHEIHLHNKSNEYMTEQNHDTH